MTYDETVKQMSYAASLVKLICGVANNAAWLVMLEGLKHARMCPNFKHGVRRNFNLAMRAIKEYESNLLNAEQNRMFHLADLSPEVRKKYGDITDHEYYDFWARTGGEAYRKTKPLITSLWNKYRLSLEREHIDEADHVAWVMVAMAALELAVQMYGKAIDECEKGFRLPRKILERVFSQFSLQTVVKAWKKALLSLCPGTDHITPSEIDERNIEMGLTQLCEAWIDPTLLYNSTMDTVEDSIEVFRTKGEMKKSLREIAEVRDETMKELENE